MRVRATLIVVVVSLLAALVVPLIAFAQDGHAATLTLTTDEKMLVDLINKERTKRGLAKVTAQNALMKAARNHSTEMGERQYFAHNSYNGESFAKRLVRHGYKKSGYSFWKVGEDIYWGSGLESSPVAAVQAWMKSSTHRAVILTKCFRHIGVGIVVSDSGYGSCSKPVTFFTLDLGRRKL
jgi:uncharacterized protein YkwD